MLFRSEVRMLDPPNFPTKPSKPNRLMLCGAGLVLGLVLGAGTAAAFELGGGRVYSEKEIKKLVPFPVMVEIPRLPTTDEQRSERRQVWAATIAAVIMTGMILVGTAVTYLRG